MNERVHITMIAILYILLCLYSVVSAEKHQAAFVVVSETETKPKEMSKKDTTKFRLPAKPFCGPKHLNMFSDFCLEKKQDDANYVYTICPYANITQLDTSQFAATPVAIGTWHGWLIDNNTLLGWHFYGGDPCSGVSREGKVFFKCGPSNVITSLSEPSKCIYHFTMEGPTFCNEDALLVYPHLSDAAKHQWDLIFTQFTQKNINQKMYDMLLTLIFEEEKLLVTTEDKEKYKQIVEQEQPAKFETLYACETEYSLMKLENQLLRSMTSKESLVDLEEQMAAARQKQLDEQNNNMAGGGGGGFQGNDYYDPHYMDYARQFDDL